jgi:hypothetical protein
MSKTTNILPLMIRDHCEIEELINDLEKKSKMDFN